MSGTIKTIPSLLNEWRAGQAAGSLISGDVRDIISTLDINIPYISILGLGAIGDGVSHPLSGVTSFLGNNTTGYTLGQWQALLPSATATTNELNWAIIQSAIAAAITAGGGTIFIPAASGNYVISNANSSSDSSGQIQLPNCGELGTGAPAGKVINIVGEGFQLSVLSWPSDLGSGKAGIVCTTSRTTNQSFGLIQDIGLVGPGAADNMHGILWAGRRRLVRVSCSLFNHGFDILGDQTILIDINGSGNNYGIYFASTSGASYYNNNTFHRCIFSNNTVAGIAVASATPIGETAFYDCSIDQEPYGLYKESTGFTILDGCVFVNTQFEALTTALAGDSQGASATSAIANSVFINTSFTWGGSKGRAILQLNTLQNTQFIGLRGETGGQWSPGSVCTFQIGTNQNNLILCDVAQLVANAAGSSLPIFNTDYVPIRNFDMTAFGQPKGSISAAGTNQGNATILAHDENDVTSVSSSQGVQLPAIQGRGSRVRVFNHGGATLSVYPPSGGAINALSTNAAYSLSAGSTIQFITFESTTQWYTVP